MFLIYVVTYDKMKLFTMDAVDMSVPLCRVRKNQWFLREIVNKTVSMKQRRHENWMLRWFALYFIKCTEITPNKIITNCIETTFFTFGNRTLQINIIFVYHSPIEFKDEKRVNKSEEKYYTQKIWAKYDIRIFLLNQLVNCHL